MKSPQALTVCQPFAHLIALKQKPIENRTWATSYRGELYIHAGKATSWLDPDDIATYPDMAFGAVVAVVELVACLDYQARWADQYQHLHNHEHANGPWCWVVDDVFRLPNPVWCRGAQQLWMPTPDVIRSVQEQRHSSSFTDFGRDTTLAIHGKEVVIPFPERE